MIGTSVARPASRPKIVSKPSYQSSWPDDSNTGVPAGTTLTNHSGDFTTTSNNQVVDALNITGTLTISHTGVLVKRCKIKQTSGYLVAVLATGATIQDSELDGSLAGTTGLQLRNGVQALRLNIHGCENGGDVWANSSSNRAKLQDSWIHDLSPEGSGFHTDGFQFDPDASWTTFEHNHFDPIPAHTWQATSCINFNNESTGTNNNITVNNNLLDGRGAGFCCYFPRFSGWSNIVVTNNRMTRGQGGTGGYNDGGDPADWPNGGVTTFSGNVDHLSGAAISVSQ